jgi:hypothetical protein
MSRLITEQNFSYQASEKKNPGATVLSNDLLVEKRLKRGFGLQRLVCIPS